MCHSPNTNISVYFPFNPMAVVCVFLKLESEYQRPARLRVLHGILAAYRISRDLTCCSWNNLEPLL